MGKAKNVTRYKTELIARLKIVQVRFPKDPYQMKLSDLEKLARKYGVESPPIKPYVKGMQRREQYYDA